MNALSAARARYLQNKHDAMRAAVIKLAPLLGVEFRLVEFSRSTMEALDSWQNAEFDWAEIDRRHRDAGTFKFGIWVGDRLTAVALATVSGQSVRLEFVEGEQFDACPLKGKRILIALEAVANYAQARGKNEIVLEPINPTLISLYEDVYGFEAVRPRKGSPYWRKRI